MVSMAEQAAEVLAGEGIDVEIVDPRTTSPLDLETIFESVEETGRLVIVDESYPRCSLAADISAQVAQERFDALKAPIRMVTAPHTPPPFSSVLEDAYIPSADRVAAAVRDVAGAAVAS
jgi:acetoin:2,6-dichlorophenolindophenol oxidoreductase subunit beta